MTLARGIAKGIGAGVASAVTRGQGHAQAKTFLLYDNFTGASQSLIGKAATRGGTWTKLTGASNWDGVISQNGSGSAVFTSATTSPPILTPSEAPPTDVVITADITLGTSFYVLFARLAGAGSTGYNGYIYYLRDNQKAQIYKVVNGTGTLLAESVSTYTGTKRFEFRVEGSNLIGLVDGVEVCSASDSTYTTGTIGFTLNGNGSFGRIWASATLPPVTSLRTYLVAGQSNAAGWATNLQEWSSSTHVPWLYGNDDRWRVLMDPYDYWGGEISTAATDTSAFGSWLPKFCTDLMAKYQADVVIIPAAKGASAISQWQPSAPSDRETLYGNAQVRANAVKAITGRISRVLFWQGETDALNAVSKATYKAALETFVDAIATATGAKVRQCILQECIGTTTENLDRMRDAVTELAATNSNLLVGPDLSDISTAPDNFHPKTDANMLDIGARWAAME